MLQYCRVGRYSFCLSVDSDQNGKKRNILVKMYRSQIYFQSSAYSLFIGSYAHYAGSMHLDLIQSTSRRNRLLAKVKDNLLTKVILKS